MHSALCERMNEEFSVNEELFMNIELSINTKLFINKKNFKDAYDSIAIYYFRKKSRLGSSINKNVSLNKAPVCINDEFAMQIFYHLKTIRQSEN